MQTRVCQIDTECTDCSPSPQATKWIEAVSKLQQTQECCYYYGAQNRTRKHSKVCKAKNYICGRCEKEGTPDSLCRSARTPLHILEAQDYSSPQPIQSEETPQDYNQSLGTP